MSDEQIHPRGWWKLSRPCYDQSHRCPGGVGGGMSSPKTIHCRNGYITVGISKAELAVLDFEGDAWRGYPHWFALGQCTRCDVRVLPSWVRKFDPTWWSYSARKWTYR